MSTIQRLESGAIDMSTKRSCALAKMPGFDSFLKELNELEDKHGFFVITDRIVKKEDGKPDFSKSLDLSRINGKLDMRIDITKK